MSIERELIASELEGAERAFRSAASTARHQLATMDSLVYDPECIVGERTAEPVRSMAMAVESLGRVVALRIALIAFDTAMENKSAAKGTAVDPQHFSYVSAHARGLADGQRRRAEAGPDPEDEDDEL